MAVKLWDHPTGQETASAPHEESLGGFVRVRERGTAGDRPFLVMDLMRAGSLRRIIENRETPASSDASPRLIGAFAELARVVATWHREGRIHGGIKPDNLFPDGTGRILLADPAPWNSAAAAALSWFDQDPTTARYLAPEQLAGSERRTVPATDVHALAACLHEALTARLPYRDPHSPRKPSRKLTRPLRALLERALAIDPAERTPTATDLADELSRLICE